jgi:cellulose biosynthesis protein BcsQ
VRSNHASRIRILSVKNVDMRLELVVIPVSDVDRAKQFYGSDGTRTRHEVEVLAELTDQHGALLLPAIPRRVVVADAAVAGEPVDLFAPYSEAAEAFTALAKRLRQ